MLFLSHRYSAKGLFLENLLGGGDDNCHKIVFLAKSCHENVKKIKI